MAELIAKGTAELASSDFTLVDGQSTTLNLKPANSTLQGLASDQQASVQIKTADNGYVNVGVLTHTCPAQIVSGPGTFRVVRHSCSNSTGVDRT